MSRSKAAGLTLTPSAGRPGLRRKGTVHRLGPGALALAILGASLTSPGIARALCVDGEGPDCVRARESFLGTVDFFATGASFTFTDDADDDRPGGLLEVAEVVVPQRRIPPRATLKRAFLYFGGSLFDDEDGRDAPDTTVQLKVPGSDVFREVRGEQVYTSGRIAAFPELTLYTVRADITALMQEAGGEMAGAYQVRGFDADIFHFDEKHTAANASFSIILVFEEPRLPPRTIVLFDGMQEVLGSTVSLALSGFSVSPVPSGALTIYAQEGDCHPGPQDCAQGNNLAGLERVRVIGAEPSRSLVLSDDVNPPNDVFNRTINTVDPPLVDVPGTDIDTFDISPVLRAGDRMVTVEITTPFPRDGQAGELIGLVYVVVGIDVFAPELREDSRIDIRTARGEELEAYYPGDPLQVTFALSNTGNMPGTGVRLATDLPPNATGFVVARRPEGAMVTVDERGGAHGRGRVEVSELAVRHGEVNDLVLLVETECPLERPSMFTMSASVSAPLEGSVPFSMTSSVALLARGICGPRFFLYGGGGCQAAGSIPAQSPWGPFGAALALLMALLALRRWRSRLAILLVGLSLGSAACGESVTGLVDRDPPRPRPLPCPGGENMVVVPSIRGAPPYCIDQYEATVEGALGNAVQPPGGDGSTLGVARSLRFTLPSRGVTWFQARAACVNAGKRLCTADEWITACGGDEDLTYPYGDAYQPGTCNGFHAARGAPVEAGAMIRPEENEDGFSIAEGCVSTHGAYDLSGNLWEWNGSSYLEGARRGLAGGSFRSNAIGLRCVTGDNHADPAEENDGFGFRCCRDFPR